MTIKELRASAGMSQAKFSEYFGIPTRTIENWESASPTGKRTCPPYLIELMEYKLKTENLLQECRPE